MPAGSGAGTSGWCQRPAVASLEAAYRPHRGKELAMTTSLDGWDIVHHEAVPWVPWGSAGDALARVLGSADGFVLAVIAASPGCHGDPHVHQHPEFLYVVQGAVRTQGRVLQAGDAYAAAAGSHHDDFGTERGATYLSIFKL